MVKTCNKCLCEKPLSEFPKNKFGCNGYYSQCKVCKNSYKRKYNVLNKDKRVEYRNSRKHIGLWRSVLKMSIWRMNGKKQGKTIDLLGYSALEFKQHIESLFTEGMSWENHGEWHVDHKKPMALFEFTNTDDEGFKECWKLENLQPLWGNDNLSKGPRYLL